jgi:hypothetical protein
MSENYQVIQLLQGEVKPGSTVVVRGWVSNSF